MSDGSSKISKLDLIIVILVALLGLVALVPLFKKPDDVLLRQAHRAERYKLNTMIELHAMDNDGVYPKTMVPSQWFDSENYFPELDKSKADEALFCNQGSVWEINPDHKLSMLGHGIHE